MTKKTNKYLNKVSKLRLNGKNVRSTNIKTHNKGFSLIELIIVIAILIIIAVLGIPFFFKLIDMARFSSAKNHMRDSFTSCINAPNIAPTNPYIPGVAFQSSNCSSLMTATIDNSCTISMDMSTGVKTGWTDSYDQCVSGTNNSSSNGNGNGNGNYDEGIVFGLNNEPESPYTVCVSRGELTDNADWGIGGGAEWGWNKLGQAVITTKNASTGEDQAQMCRDLQNGVNPFE